MYDSGARLTVYKHQSEETRYLVFDHENKIGFVYDDREFLRKLYLNPAVGTLDPNNIDSYSSKHYYDKIYTLVENHVIADTIDDADHKNFFRNINRFYERIYQKDVFTISMMSKLLRIPSIIGLHYETSDNK